MATRRKRTKEKLGEFKKEEERRDDGEKRVEF